MRTKGKPFKQLTEEDIHLVEVIARAIVRGLPSSIELDDLIGNGMLGLLDAARRYDPASGRPFLPYAKLRIRGAILDYVRRELTRLNRETELPAEVPAPQLVRSSGLSAQQKALLSKAEQAIMLLDQREQQVLHLVHVEGLTTTQIATERRLAPAALKKMPRGRTAAGKWVPTTERRVREIYHSALRSLKDKLAA